jgi:hypothetical protein
MLQGFMLTEVHVYQLLPSNSCFAWLSCHNITSFWHFKFNAVAAKTWILFEHMGIQKKNVHLLLLVT